MPRLEAAGVIVRVPTAWRANRPATSASDGHRRGQAAVGSRHGRAARLQDGRQPRRRTADQGGDRATARRVERPCTWCADAGSKSIANRLGRMLDEFRAVETAAAQDGLSFGEAMRLLAGAHVTERHRRGHGARLVTRGRRDRGWPKTLAGLRDPARLGRNWIPADCAEGDVAALPAGRRAMAASALQPRPGRLPRRRHGPGQDDAGAGAVADAQGCPTRRSER